MSNEPNPIINEVIEEIEVDSSRTSYNEWTKKVVENLVDAEKRWIEMASEQNALTMKAIREGVNFYRTAPTPALADWARQGVEGLLEAQRKWVESATQQRSQFFQAQQQTTEGEIPTAEATNAAATMTSYAQQQVEAMVETRKRWLDYASRQNAQFLTAVRDGLRMPASSPATTLTDWSQQAMDSYVQMQKRWLDLATQLPFQRPGSNNK